MEIENDSDQEVSYDAAPGSAPPPGDLPDTTTVVSGTLAPQSSVAVSIASTVTALALDFKLTVSSGTCTTSTLVTGAVNSKTVTLNGSGGQSCSEYTISVT